MMAKAHYTLMPEPTGGEVYVVLVVAALQRVERPVDLAGKFLAAVHTLPLEVVT